MRRQPSLKHSGSFLPANESETTPLTDVPPDLDPHRRGARSAAHIDPVVIAALERGAPSVNHLEQMSLKMDRLFVHAFPELKLDARMMTGLQSSGFITRLRVAGNALLTLGGPAAVAAASRHRSDTVRGWAAFATYELFADDVPSLVEHLRIFAADSHFAVREWAWLAARPAAVTDTDEYLTHVTPAASSADPNVRRFASESTRPRGVWSRHIPLLCTSPEAAEPLLSALIYDEHPYVRKSVGNWLNDAAKSRASWVRSAIARWEGQGEVPPAIKRRALRSI